MPGIRQQFFSYFGAKRRNAKKYPAPLYPTVIEPFAGSAGYAHEHFEKNIILVDAFKPVIEAWQFLIESNPSDIRRLPLLEPGQELSSIEGLSDGERAFIGFWLIRAGATPRNKLSSWSGKWANRFWGEHIRERIAQQVDLISHWQAHHTSYDQLPDLAATWFVDPPYVEAGSFYPKSDIDYGHLGKWCRSRSGQVIVCESTGAGWLPFKPLYVHTGIQRKPRQEVVWLSEQ